MRQRTTEQRIIEQFTLYRFSTGRRLFTLKVVLALARAHGNPLIIACSEEAIAFDEGTRATEAAWNRTRGRASAARGNAVEIDAQIDRQLVGMHTGVSALHGAARTDSPLWKLSGDFLAHNYPDGPGVITNSAFEDELETVEEMLKDIVAMRPEDVAALAISYYVGELTRLAPLLATELSTPTEGMRFEAVRAAREEGHENLCTLIGAIVSQYRGRTAENASIRAALLAPINAQNERVAERRRKRASPDVDVDPETGEEIVTPPGPTTGTPPGTDPSLVT